MKDKSISIFLPVRKGSQRIEHKNTKPFAIYNDGLLELKLIQLSKLSNVEEVVLSTNDEICLKIGKKIQSSFQKLRIVKRPDNLATNSVDLIDLVNYVPSVCKGKHILWTHVTSPFVDESDYEKAIFAYFKAIDIGFDSLMSVQAFRNFLWDKEGNDLINRCTTQKWPRTQDLKDLYEIDSAIFLTKRSTYIDQSDRIGIKPFLYIQAKLKSFDIDWEDDFQLAELIYQKKSNNSNL